MDWFRHYHGLCTDPKLHRVSRAAGVSRAIVIAAWCSLLEQASQNNERGSVGDIDPVGLAFTIDVKPSVAAKILAQFVAFGMVVEGGKITAWNERQRASDDSSERQRKNRRRVSEINALKNNDTEPSCHDTKPPRTEQIDREKERENPTAVVGDSDPVPQPVIPPQPAASRYRWDGKVIKLNEADFERWQRAFHSLDLEAHITDLDAWLSGFSESSRERKTWFQVTSGALRKRHQAAVNDRTHAVVDYRERFPDIPG